MLEAITGNPTDGPAASPWAGKTESSGDDEGLGVKLNEATRHMLRLAIETDGSAVEQIVLDIRVCSLGRFSMHEQVQLGKAADVYYSVHGNEMSNVLWMRGAGSASIEI